MVRCFGVVGWGMGDVGVMVVMSTVVAVGDIVGGG